MTFRSTLFYGVSYIAFTPGFVAEIQERRRKEAKAK